MNTKAPNMTKYFEVTRRDGPARIGKLILKNLIETPHIIETESLGEKGPIISMGSFLQYKSKKDILNFVKKSKSSKMLIILPYSPFSSTKEIPGSKDLDDIAKGVVIDPSSVYKRGQKEPGPFDLYVIACSNQLKTDQRAFVRSISEIREKISSDAALYIPAFATPENLSILVYLGVDIFDDTMAEISGYQDIYLTADGAFQLSWMGELPCTCKVCQNTNPAELKKLQKKERSLLLARHNKLKLDEELKKTKEFIKNGVIREYVEKQCRSSPFLTASLRLIDADPQYLEKRTPVARKNLFYANSMESLNRVEVKRFSERVQKRYSSPKKGVLVLLPCSAKKPYSISQTHQKFIKALFGLRGNVQEVIISSPLGVVPRELETVYPAAFYDVPVTGYWDREEREWVFSSLKKYMKKNSYDHIIAHLDGPYKEICQKAADELGLDVKYTSSGRVTSPESLERLRDAVKKPFESYKEKDTNFEPKKEVIRAIADYQFGVGASDLLMQDKIRISGRFPAYHVYSKDQHFMALNEYGLINLSIKAAKAILSLGSYQVRIDDFELKGSVLAPGVIDSDLEIRENDEVIVLGKKGFGVGRAKMGGWEMMESKRGVAVDVRHVGKFPR